MAPTCHNPTPLQSSYPADAWWSVDLGAAVPLKYVDITATSVGTQFLQVRVGNASTQYGWEGVAVQSNLLYVPANQVREPRSTAVQQVA